MPGPILRIIAPVLSRTCIIDNFPINDVWWVCDPDLPKCQGHCGFFLNDVHQTSFMKGVWWTWCPMNDVHHTKMRVPLIFINFSVTCISCSAVCCISGSGSIRWRFRISKMSDLSTSLRLIWLCSSLYLEHEHCNLNFSSGLFHHFTWYCKADQAFQSYHLLQ